METEKAFILINTVKCIGDEYKAVTQSGTEIYVKKDELIPYVRFPEGPDEAFGFVKINGKAFTADTVKIIIQIYEGLIGRFEYETEQDAEIGKSQRKQSNADRIRGMTNEELAEYLITFQNTFGEEHEGMMSCLDWLKQPMEE